MAVASRKLFRGRVWRERTSFYLFIAPWLIGFVALGVIPLVLGLATSFTNYDGFNVSHLQFVGLSNYQHAIFGDSDAVFSAGRTLLFAIIYVPLAIGLALGVAMLLNLAVPGRGAFRSLFYLPHVVPIIASVWVWKIFVDQNYGLLNALIDLVWPQGFVRWLVDYPTDVLIALMLWAGLGGGMVIFLAGLQGVPNELKEAARMDGANAFQIFGAVTLPMLTPVIFFELILTIIGALQVLVAPMLLTGGSSTGALPPRDNYLFLVHVYSEVFGFQRFGYGTALLWLLFVAVVALSLVVFRSSRHWVYYEVEPEEAKQ